LGSVGINQLNAILKQDVYKTEVRTVIGCRICNIVPHKSQNLQLEKYSKKGKAKIVIDNNNNNNNNSNNDDNDDNNKPTRRYRTTSETEKEILKPLLLYSEFSNDNTELINYTLKQLNTEWDLSRVKKYWSNHNFFRSVKK
jgi:hypothetical protein